ncbi:MAG TPA: hypothetical protein VN259_12195 [Xanthomonadales bacterium]|nr:hypothetical protein [Xanthomonadales bacterium]
MATMWMGVLALEPVAGALPQRQMLTRATAEGLNAAMGAQLARFLPHEHEYGFVWSAAIYDPAQLLRRGFPLYQELANLFVAGQRHGVDAGQCLTLCELDGRMPTALLEPESGIGGGTLYVIPIAVTGSEQAIAAASEKLESELYEQGLADAAVVFELHRDLGVAFEHVRLMSLMDLSAMMAAQLEHVGFGCAWQLIEELLYAKPPREIEVISPLGQSLKLDDDAVWLAFEPYSLHARRHSGDAQTRLASYAEKLHEFRQLQGLLAAHGIAVRVRLPQADTEHACSRQSDDFVIESVSEGTPTRALLHEAAGLGALAFTLVDALGSIIEHRYPLSAGAIGRFRGEAAQRGWVIERLQRVVLSADGLDLAAADDAVRH